MKPRLNTDLNILRKIQNKTLKQYLEQLNALKFKLLSLTKTKNTS